MFKVSDKRLSDVVCLPGAKDARSKDLSAEIAQLRRDLDILIASREAVEFNGVDLRSSLATAEERLARVRETVSFKLGHALVSGFTSWRGFLLLPSNLWSAYVTSRSLRKRRAARPALNGPDKAADRMRLAHLALAKLDIVGAAATYAWLDRRRSNPACARAFADCALALADLADLDAEGREALRFALRAAELDPDQARLRKVAYRLASRGARAVAIDLLTALDAAGTPASPGDRALAQSIAVSSAHHDQTAHVPLATVKPASSDVAAGEMTIVLGGALAGNSPEARLHVISRFETAEGIGGRPERAGSYQ